ncbi:MAG: PmoA family protein [Flavobacteriaceae bacterium]|nr:PmoA family protein [Flavobacteriaceae bacterium]
MKKHFLYAILLGLGFLSCTDTPLELVPIYENTYVPNSIASAELNKSLLKGDLRLIELSEKGKKEVPYQKDGTKIYWKTSSDASRYRLEKEKPTDHNPVQLIENEEQLEVYQNGTKIIGYQKALKEVPEGVSETYQRSGYLHPVNTPKGKRLTRIQPEDHYHHYGIWNPWTHTLFEGDTLDFWNLNKKQGTVRFAKLLKKNTGPIFSEIEVLHEHVVLKDGANKVALNEIQNIKTTPLSDTQYLMDITINYECATEESFKIIQYRYGGFGWRTTEEWDNQNSRVLSSEGNTRKTADGSTARWCIVDGKLGQGYGGALMLSHPENYNHPEPLRVWPDDMYGRGDLFVNFATTKTTDWTFEPGKKYTLKYQLIVYDGTMETTTAEQAWKQFAEPLHYQLKP